jgi:UDP-glucose 4-epimerase
MSQKILVTGGLGFIGSHTVVELHNAGYEPVIIDNLSNSKISVLEGIEHITGTAPIFYQEDFTNPKALQKIFDEHDISGIIHFAAYKAVNESLQKPLDYYTNNVAGLITLIKSMRSNGIGNLVFSSSCTVYGVQKVYNTEAAPLKQLLHPYGASKQL